MDGKQVQPDGDLLQQHDQDAHHQENISQETLPERYFTHDGCLLGFLRFSD